MPLVKEDEDDPLYLFVIKLGDEDTIQEKQCCPDYFKNNPGLPQPVFVGKCGECDSYHKKPMCR